MGVGTGPCVIHALSGDLSTRWVPLGQAVVRAKAALALSMAKLDDMDPFKRKMHRMQSVSVAPGTIT